MTGPVETAPIDLSHEADFTIGAASVRPSRRAFSVNGAEETIEPRVMQVLVALARRVGEVVSRDDLVAMCWGGRVVGDDAISRPIALLRKLGETSSAFSIETVPRVGYRLTAKGEGMKPAVAAVAAVSADKPEAENAASAKRRGPVAMALAGLLALAMVVALLVFLPRGPAPSSASASVAVMPFTSQNKDDGYLATGLTAELVTRLRTITGLTIAGGDWMPALSEQISDPKALAERLAVEHLLTGSIQRDGKVLRIYAQLTIAANGHVVWSKTYDDVAPDDIFALQDRIALTVANALSVALDVGQQSTQQGGTKNFDAYDHYLRGRFLRNNPNTAGPVGELETAVKIDPNYARAWAELVNAYGGVARVAPANEQWEAAMQKMDDASKEAEKLAPKSWTGHTGRGWYFVGRNNWVEADAAMNRAAARGEIPDTEFHGTIRNFYNQVGRYSLGWIRTQKINSLDPYLERSNSEVQYFLAMQRYAEGWVAYDAGQKNPYDYNLEFSGFWMAMADNKPERAHAILKKLAEKTNPWWGKVDAMLESKPALRAEMQAILDDPSSLRGRLSTAALFAGHVGDRELALKLLRRAYIGPGWAGNFLIWHPQLAETRKTEGFKLFVRDVGFLDMYRKSGNWGDFCRPTTGDDFECS